MVPQQQRRRRRRVVSRTAERRVVVERGVGGFGFTIAGQRPCVVSAVAAGGPAERAGLRAGDALLAVDGASVARAPHAAVARLVAAAPAVIAVTVAPREPPPTDTEDTEPDERARTRRRHPPPRRRPQPLAHHPACHSVPSPSGVSEILQNLSRTQLGPHHAARLECRAVVGYLGTIETPQAAATGAPGNVRTAVRKLRQERRPAAPVLLSVLPGALLLRRPTGQLLAQYPRERIVYAGCGSEADRRYFGLVTAAETAETEASHSCHVFAVDPRMAEHDSHLPRARDFQIACTRDPVAERCLEFPPSAEYVVGVVRGMYSLPADDCTSPSLLQISKLAVKGDSPAMGNFARCNRPVFRVPRDRRPCRHDDAQDFIANSPQPSNHSEITTTSSNSDSGIGFHNDCRNIADRILVVDFARQQPATNRFRQDMPRRPTGLVGCNSFDADGSFLSNTTPVVDGFGGQGRPLNLDDVIINSNDLQPVRHVSPRAEDDTYNYNNIYGNVPSTSKQNGAVYDQVYTETEGHQYELIPTQLDVDLEVDSVTETFNSVEIYDERSREPVDYHSNESIENVTVISGGTSKASMDSVSMYSSRSHEDARPARRKHLQASLDDMLVLGMRDSAPIPDKDEGKFLHPASIKCKVRKSKPLNLLSRTKDILTGRDRGKEKERRRAISASAGDVCAGAGEGEGALPAAASEPDLRDAQSEQGSPFRRWTTSGGAGSSYRHHDPRTIYTKQMSEGAGASCAGAGGGGGGCGAGGGGGGGSGVPPDGPPKNFFHTGKSRCQGVSRWSLGLEYLLEDSCGVAAFSFFLANEFAHENIRFWWYAQHFHMLRDQETREVLAHDLWGRHLADHCPEPVNLDAATRQHTANLYSQHPLPPDLFEADRQRSEELRTAAKQIFNVMRFDSYPRFLRSGVHAECARADLRGQPTPYRIEDSKILVPPSPALDGILALYSDLPMIKKAILNLTDRRRSGGSLIPWRLRAASRDRAQAGSSGAGASGPGSSGPVASGAGSAASAASGLPPQPPTPTPSVDSNFSDVVRTQNEGQCSLCRVVLPDRATSVVTLDASVTVRQLIDRLLQRRKLACMTYDVVLKDKNQVEVMLIDPAQPSTVLAGHVVSVDRRCTLRIDVNDRLVSVRCRPNRQLQHIVKPVLKRYGTEALLRAKNRVVLRDGALIDLTTTIQELDGARLQIVDLDSADARRVAATPPPGDAASEPPFRIQEELRDMRLDEPVQRPPSSASRYQSELATDSPMPGPSGLQRWQATEASSSSSDASGHSGGGARGAEGSSRVRAALRPGAPVHHHPPDFLENLRETQRQRLQVREPEAAAGARAPPPLPPKPPHRAPTLV